MEENRFCTRCGAELPEGASFCPECGSPLDHGSVQNPSSSAIMKQGLGLLGIFILLYGVLAIIYGIMDMTSSIGLTESSYNELVESLSEIMGMDMSQYMPVWSADMPMLMTMSMAFLTISGVLAIVCYIISKKRNDWKMTVILCAASAIACLGMCCFTFYASIGIFLCAIGLVMTAMIYTKKDCFSC